MSTWEERMAARAGVRAEERRMGFDTIALAEQAELQRWGILPPPDGAAGPPIEGNGWSPWFRVCLECWPDAAPAPARYVWSAAEGRWVWPDWDLGPHVWGLHEPDFDDLYGPQPLGTCRHWCHYVGHA